MSALESSRYDSLREPDQLTRADLIRMRGELLQYYSVRSTDYVDLLRIQEGKCAICGARPTEERRLCVDHDHETGVVRGLLCDSCNLGLGHLEDNIGPALRYVIRNAGKVSKYGSLRAASRAMKSVEKDARRASRGLARLAELQEQLTKYGIEFKFDDVLTLDPDTREKTNRVMAFQKDVPVRKARGGDEA